MRVLIRYADGHTRKASMTVTYTPGGRRLKDDTDTFTMFESSFKQLCNGLPITIVRDRVQFTLLQVKESKNQYVVVFGNPFDGMELYGPFDAPTDGTVWATEVERQVADQSWWVVKLERPF